MKLETHKVELEHPLVEKEEEDTVGDGGRCLERSGSKWHCFFG